MPCPSLTTMVSLLNKSCQSISTIHFYGAVKNLGGSASYGSCAYKFKISWHRKQKRDMAGNNRQKKSSFFSVFNIFKACFSPGGDDTEDEASTHEGSEENRRGWVGDCGIDKRFSDYIVKFHATKVSDTQTHAV